MIAKTFEVRDLATFIPVLAVKLEPACEADRYLLARSGYGRTADLQRWYVLVSRLAGGGEATTDPHGWTFGRTLTVAHHHLIKHFDELESGAVIDVQHILGETESPKLSEAVEVEL